MLTNITNAALSSKLEVDVTNPEDGIRVTQNGTGGCFGGATATPSDFNCNKFLTVDASGEVILVDGTTCGASSNLGGDAFEVSGLQSQIDDLKNQITELKALLGAKAGSVVK